LISPVGVSVTYSTVLETVAVEKQTPYSHQIYQSGLLVVLS
jgi:hypothetical protein